jgi:hypothetical protein
MPRCKSTEFKPIREEFSDGLISLTDYLPKTLKVRISIGGNQKGSGYENNQGNRGPPATDS